MKKIVFLITTVLLIALAGFGQAPGILNYQGVARNSVGNVLVNQNITLRLTIRNNTAAGPVVYQESRAVTTNPFGLFNVQVGSPGAISVTGTVAGVNWAVGDKYIQVEIDPNGGSSFINIGTAQLASVPYSLYSALSGDLVLPFNKTQADAGTLFKITNSGTGSGSTALEGLTNSTAGSANGIIGTVTSTTPGGFSAGVRGINNGTGGLGIGVYGSQAGSGWGVYGISPSGLGVFGSSSTGTGVNGFSTSSTGVYGNSTTGNAGLFEVSNTASTADALRATTAGTGASWAIRGISSGTNGAGLFQQTNATNTSNNLQSNQAGLGRAGLFNVTNAANATVGVQINTNGALASKALGVTHTGFGAGVDIELSNTANVNNALQIDNKGLGRGALIQSTNNANNANIIDAFNAGPGWVMNISSSNATPRALQTQGAIRHSGLGEANNFVLRSDATGNATWVDPALLLPGSTLWTRTGTNTWATNLGDNVGVGTSTPTHKFTVSHGGSTGISVSSTSGFSVVDINAANGDAALRFGAAGINQWNMRNQPGTNNLEWFELGGGGSRMILQDATGNLGIGQGSPAYRLDVLHGGSTGARIQSSSSFSVLDIDAASGDAALRFANAGVNQWNMRNDPGNNNLQIFELGGGGERMHIQNGTGNVSIGGEASPTYRLDVLHGGATGIRSRSSSSFSVVDIDASSGDAALRFANNGVNQWNMRNDPANNNLQIFELGGGGERMHIQNGTGNVSIGGETSPTYRLDVLHGGATGIRSRSSSSFSVVDIDASSGDAALRFANNGVNQWNMRNDPANNNLQIFELGGGGERMRIENTSGNIAVGNADGTYRLDVLHGGFTGIRSKSSSSFSVVDIDAASGDAALRFANAGVDQWNTRNNPSTDNYQIFDMSGGGERMRIEKTTGNVVVAQDFTVVGTKAFTMDHPLDPENKILRHAAAESNEVINFYSGNITTDGSGKATVKLPDYFGSINKDPRYQLTVIGSFAQAIVSKEVSNNQFEIATNVPNVKVSWEVKAVRNDARMQKHPFVEVEEKTGALKGKYWDAESHNQPARKGYTYDSNVESSLNSSPKTTNRVATVTTGGSLDQQAIVTPVTNKNIDAKGTSIEDVPAAKTAPQNLSVDGSVAPQQPQEKKAEAKPVDVKGTSVEQIKPIEKPVEQKKISNTPESTKTE